MMTSRELVKRAIRFQGVARMPHFLPDGKENDLLWLWIPGPDDAMPWTRTGNGLERRVDSWGVVYERVVGSALAHGEKAEVPIADIARQLDYIFPDLNNLGYFQRAREVVARSQASANPKYCLGVMPFSSLNEGTHNLIELDRMLVAYYEYPDHLKALVGRLAAAQRESIRRLAEIGCDGVMGYDDWGLQDRLMVGIPMIEDFFKPHYETNWKLAHELGMDVWLHSCGYILPLLSRFHEWGLDVIQMDQQENMGLENLDREAGGRLAFWCPVDIQKTMVEGTVDDIRAYVHRMINTIGAHNGGLISMAYSTPESVKHSPEKIMAMCEAFRTYGVYAGSV